MGQKTNAISLRISNRLDWQSTWNTDSQSFSNTLYKDLEIRRCCNYLITKFGFSANSILLEKWKNQYLLTTKLTSPADFLPSSKKNKYLSYITRKNTLDSFDQYFSTVSPYQKDIFFHFLDARDPYYLLSKPLSRKELNFFKDRTKLSFWPFISSSFVSNYIARQLALPLKLRDNEFKKNLRKGVVELSKIFFNSKTSHFISGIKVICSGRWQKTKSSRKQKLVYCFGKLKRQTFYKYLDYSFVPVTTKYGVCGIKVLIAYKNLNDK